MRKDGRECGKRDAIGEGERDREDDGRVRFILGLVEDTVGEDVVDRVGHAGVVVREVGGDWEECRVPGIGDYSRY